MSHVDQIYAGIKVEECYPKGQHNSATGKKLNESNVEIIDNFSVNDCSKKIDFSNDSIDMHWKILCIKKGWISWTSKNLMPQWLTHLHIYGDFVQQDMVLAFIAINLGLIRKRITVLELPVTFNVSASGK